MWRGDILDRVCFDAASCFRHAEPAEIDRATCTIAASGDVNVALATEGDGACGAWGCFVPLDAESDFGWRRTPEGRIALPKAVCSAREPGRPGGFVVVTSPVTPGCFRKRIGDPLCAADEAPPIVLAARQRRPSSLAVSDEEVFWTEQGSLGEPECGPRDGTVKRVALQGGTPETLASGQAMPRQIVLDRANDRVLWTNRGGDDAAASALMQRSLDRGEPSVLYEPPVGEGGSAPGGRLEGLATDGKSVFWTLLRGAGVSGSDASGSVQSLPLQGREMPKRHADVESSYRLAAGDGVVCWTDHGKPGGKGAVSCLDLKSGEKTPIGEEEQDPYGIALDGTEVFWVNFGGEVVRGDVRGGGREVLFKGDPGPYGIALDEDWVYWTNRLDGTVSRLRREAPRDEPMTLAAGQRSPAAIAVDTRAIYWINEGSRCDDGAVVRLAKPLPP